MRFELARLDRSISESRDGTAASAQVRDLAAMVDTAIQKVRKIAAALRPAALDYGGLVDAIRLLADEFERRTGIGCTLQIPEPVDSRGNLANCLFSICQESLTNIARHAGATAVEIRLTADPGCLALTVRDNGRGFEPDSAAQTSSLGLLGMRERARMAGGILSVISGPGEGTTILAWIPAGGGAHAGDALAAFV
jgi:signal transduction histidine kinase